MGRSFTLSCFSPDEPDAGDGASSKNPILILANMASASSQKKSKENKPPNSQDLMKDLKVDAIGQVFVLDTTHGQQLSELSKGHGKGCHAVVFSRDGKLLGIKQH